MKQSSPHGATASLENLHRIFSVPEDPQSTLMRIDRAISENLSEFLHQHIVATEQEMEEIERDFSDSQIPDAPMFVTEQVDFLLDRLVARSVHTTSPRFIGHMAPALPHFMLTLSKIMIALNQNLVKTETSKAFTPLERQVLGMLHRLIYARPESFYSRHMHHAQFALGSFGSGGTIANLTALWVARNRAFPAQGEFLGAGEDGLPAALRQHGFNDTAVLVSRRGHYSLRKACDLLGLGRRQLIGIETDARNRVRVDRLLHEARSLQSRGIKVMAIIGIAGTTETGNIDPLHALAEAGQELGCHYHIDGAWGGPTLFSDQHRPLLRGIEQADSVTIDAHKQLYVPMGAGMVLFREPQALRAIEHHAQYIIRAGSKDLGSTTLEGSRPGMALLVHSGLRIIGRRGYALLIESGIARARKFAELIEAAPDFELITAPELNILTYRYRPAWAADALLEAPRPTREKANRLLDELVVYIQKTQRERGLTFVSRTRLEAAAYDGEAINVFRVVLANPLTTDEILNEVLAEQSAIARNPTSGQLLSRLRTSLRTE